MRVSNSSMQLTRAADYGIRVMIHLVGHPDHKRISLPTLAGATATPESFLSKVLQALTHAGLLLSQRGQAGGFEISERGRQSSMRDVIEAIDGPIRLNLCLGSDDACPRRDWCVAHPVWVKAQEAMLDVLERARIQDLALASNGVAMQLQGTAHAFSATGGGTAETCECAATTTAD